MITRVLRSWWQSVASSLAVVPVTEAPVTSLESTVPQAVPAFDLVTCGTCDQPFYRVQGADPDLACIDCQNKVMSAWLVARKMGRPLWL